MGIVFHCERCGKKIEAPDNAGGRLGKCPACQNKVYVPGAIDDEEEIKLAPLDEADLARQQELYAESVRLRQDILKETEVPPEGQEPDPLPSGEASDAISEKELTAHVIRYLRQMADGLLDEAEVAAKVISQHGAKAMEVLDRIGLSDIPEPGLADVPPQVLAGLIRELRTKIG